MIAITKADLVQKKGINLAEDTTNPITIESVTTTPITIKILLVTKDMRWFLIEILGEDLHLPPKEGMFKTCKAKETCKTSTSSQRRTDIIRSSIERHLRGRLGFKGMSRAIPEETNNAAHPTRGLITTRSTTNID